MISFHVTIGVVSMHDPRVWIVGGLDPNSLMVYVVLSNLSSFIRTRLAVRLSTASRIITCAMSCVLASVRMVKNGSRLMNDCRCMHPTGVGCPMFCFKVVLQPPTISDASDTSAIPMPRCERTPVSRSPYYRISATLPAGEGGNARRSAHGMPRKQSGKTQLSICYY